MEKDACTVILLVVIIVSAFLLIVSKLARFFAGFNRETRYIVSEMNGAGDDNEYDYWRRELSCHYLCLIPFVTERNVVRLYEGLTHRLHHTESQARNDGLSHLLAPSVIGVCVCAICLCGASFAWFTSSGSTGTVKIQSAVYTVSVTATHGETDAPTSVRNGIIDIELAGGKDYLVTITPDGTATNGFCKVSFEGKEYYTVQLTDADESMQFTVHATSDSTLTVTPKWGTCAIEGQKIGSGEGDLKEIGTGSSNNASPTTPDSDHAEPPQTTPEQPGTTEPTTDTEPPVTAPATSAVSNPKPTEPPQTAVPEPPAITEPTPETTSAETTSVTPSASDSEPPQTTATEQTGDPDPSVIPEPAPDTDAEETTGLAEN